MSKESTHSKVDASGMVFICPYGHRLSRLPTGIGIFYFFLFLLSRKARNATTKLPKDISNANIPMKIEMIS